MIRFENFSFQYDAQSEPTLKKIDLTIEEREKVLIIGASGSGKSTLGQCLNGIIPNIHRGKQTGRLLVRGQEISQLSIYDRSQLISTVLQDTDGQFIGLSVGEDLAFALENDACPKDQMVSRVHYWADQLALRELLEHRPQDLSGGQKQRVSLGGVLIDESPILLFDEPLANLDPRSGQETIELIDRLHQETGATTLIIEHRLEDVLHRPVDRIVLLHDGELVFNGHPDELLASELLGQYGIREPLYISVLRGLGIDLTGLDNLSRLDELSLPDLVLPEGSSAIRPKEMEALLELSDWTFAYQPERPILRGLNLTLRRGERLAIVGKNGAGKSTLAKSLCQFVTANGTIRYLGQGISTDTVKERSERIGYVLQNPNQMISQTQISDEVALGLRLRGVDEETIASRVDKALTVCGLYPFRHWPISALSYGQKKRVTIASILVLNPEIILLDEPTAGQDQRTYREMMMFLDELNALGRTIVMITHDMQLMLEYADRCVVISDGQVLADDSPQAILNQPDILAAANLKQTSLFELARLMKATPEAVTAYYKMLQGGQHG
ncbi:ABC transporter ATP-binding protein [Streptococcus sp. E17BB]|uniref:ABC transporter ATP-binding protein n=1 Tax=Streptococcus sp. E17BB TaxID=3278714 RepID=UPI00359D7C7E